jgi:hypothetical protein
VIEQDDLGKDKKKTRIEGMTQPGEQMENAHFRDPIKGLTW